MWIDREIRDFSHGHLALLVQNLIPAIKIPLFASPAELRNLKNALLTESVRGNSLPEVTRLGISQYQHGVLKSKQDYLKLAIQAREVQKVIFAASFDPLNRLIQLFNEQGVDLDIMAEEGQQYFAGCGKVRNGFSPIHVDYAPQDSDGWEIGAASAQLAWNLYLDPGSKAGELMLWDKCWSPGDDTYQVDDNYYYEAEVVAGIDPLMVPVEVGSVFLINSRNYHAVNESENRLAFGSFISVFGDGRMRLFS